MYLLVFQILKIRKNKKVSNFRIQFFFLASQVETYQT